MKIIIVFKYKQCYNLYFYFILKNIRLETDFCIILLKERFHDTDFRTLEAFDELECDQRSMI